MLSTDTEFDRRFADPESVAEKYFTDLARLALRVDMRRAGRVAHLIAATIDAGRSVFVAGNGGSASTASHMVCDLLGTCAAAGYPHARVVGLADSAATLTALANDIGFSEVFARQLELRASTGDLLVLLSVSGESANLIHAARAARARKVRVVAATGRTDSSLGRLCDAEVCFDSDDYGLTEDLHLALNHVVARLLVGGVARTCTGP